MVVQDGDINPDELKEGDIVSYKYYQQINIKSALIFYSSFDFTDILVTDIWQARKFTENNRTWPGST